MADSLIRSFTAAGQTPASTGMDNVFAAQGGGMKAVFERLWGSGGMDRVNFNDLWDEGRYWRGRDPLLGKAAPDGVDGETDPDADNPSAGPADLDEFIANAHDRTPAEQAVHTVDSMNDGQRAEIEQRLTALLTEPMNGDDGSFSLTALTENPDTVLQEYLDKISAADRALFEGALDDMLPEAEIENGEQPGEQPLEAGHDALAFMALAIGPDAAGRIHVYLDEMDNGATLAGTGTSGNDSNDPRDRARQQAYQQFMVQSQINSQIMAINQQLSALNAESTALHAEQAKNAVRLEELLIQQAEADANVERLEDEVAEAEAAVAETEAELEAAEAGRDGAREDLTESERAVADEHQDLKQEKEDFLSEGENGDRYNFTADSEGNITFWSVGTGPDGQSERVTDPEALARLETRMNTPEGQEMLRRNQEVQARIREEPGSHEAIWDQQAVDRIEDDLAQERANLERAEQELETARARQEEIGSEIETLEARQVEIDERLLEIEQEVEALEAEKAELEQLTVEREALLEEQADLTLATADLQGETIGLNEIIIALTEDRNAAQQQIFALESQLETAQAALAAVEAERADVTDDMDTSLTRMEAAENALDQIEASREDFDQRVSETYGEYFAATNEAEAALGLDNHMIYQDENGQWVAMSFDFDHPYGGQASPVEDQLPPEILDRLNEAHEAREQVWEDIRINDDFEAQMHEIIEQERENLDNLRDRARELDTEIESERAELEQLANQIAKLEGRLDRFETQLGQSDLYDQLEALGADPQMQQAMYMMADPNLTGEQRGVYAQQIYEGGSPEVQAYLANNHPEIFGAFAEQGQEPDTEATAEATAPAGESRTATSAAGSHIDDPPLGQSLTELHASAQEATEPLEPPAQPDPAPAPDADVTADEPVPTQPPQTQSATMTA